jgi:hypothetical protein
MNVERKGVSGANNERKIHQHFLEVEHGGWIRFSP